LAALSLLLQLKSTCKWLLLLPGKECSVLGAPICGCCLLFAAAFPWPLLLPDLNKEPLKSFLNPLALPLLLLLLLVSLPLLLLFLLLALSKPNS
jgi:hypothetical protein